MRRDSAEQVDAISDSEKLVVDGSDPKSDPSEATHTNNILLDTDTTNGISTQKLLINPTIEVVVGPITPLVAAKVKVTQESLSPRQTVLPQANTTDVARPCAHIYQTTGKVIGTSRGSATQRDTSSSETRTISSFQSSTFVATSVSPAQFRDQDIVNPRHPSSIAKMDRSADPFDARIDGPLPKNSDSTSFFNHVVGLEAVSG